MGATARLYFDDPLLLDFEADVVAHGAFAGRPSVVLARSAFYPESGGQLGDRGELGGLPIDDVQVDDEGVVHHLLAAGAAVPEVGLRVRGRVERARRRLHMALHTGQHMLSRALLDEAGAETVSSRLGATSCTIDVNLAQLDEAAVARAEDLVNAVVEDDRPVRAFFPDADELARLPLRRAPKVTENVRVVDVGGFDVSPCGGTHCTRSAQVGSVSVTGLERYKGRVRVTFLAGRAAHQELTARSRALADLGRGLSSSPLEVRAAVDRMRAELASTRESLGAARERYAEMLGQSLLADAAIHGESYIACVLEGEGVETLRALASHITSVPSMVAMLASRTADGTLVVLARGAEADFDCGAWLKRVAAAHQGRGGGKADRAEGRLPPGVDWMSLARPG